VEKTRPVGEIWVGVLPENIGVVRVFERCQPQVAIGMGVIWQGASASEVRAACLMSRVPRTDWPRYLDGVQLMARVVAGIRNAEEEKHAKRRKKAK
jgi:hypothetical protein